MDIKTLKYFIVVAEELNITKASKILMMSQPPLSFQMKALEEELGTTLFIRGKRRLTLTQSGELLYKRAKDIISLNERTKDEIISLKEGLSGTISIGLVEGKSIEIASNWISKFIKENPKINFKMINSNTDELIEKMRSGLISLAVITSPFDQTFLNSFKVGEEDMIAIINDDNPLSKKDIINIEDLLNEPLILPSRKAHIDKINKWFRKYNKDINIVCESDNCLDSIYLVNRNVGVSIMPKTDNIKLNSISFKEINISDKKIEYHFVWRKGHKLTKYEEAFIDFIKDKYL